MPRLADVIVASALVVAVVIAAIAVGKVRRINCRFRVLDEIAGVADSGLPLDEALDAIAGILVPELGDFCTIDVLEGARIRRAAVRVAGPDAAAVEAGLLARKPALQERMATAAAEAC
ncbi:MAG TPA: hypothetical protein VNB59_00875 [Solirubrobacterales bacterium]|jgi:hypothetical protein|nr:hypothetical protein [Solirubrobacterales bacterium]